MNDSDPNHGLILNLAKILAKHYFIKKEVVLFYLELNLLNEHEEIENKKCVVAYYYAINSWNKSTPQKNLGTSLVAILRVLKWNIAADEIEVFLRNQKKEAEMWNVPKKLKNFTDEKGEEWVKAKNGEFPKGALIGGFDHDGVKLYIVRCEYEGSLIPGKLNPNNGHANFPWNREEKSADSYEVLVMSEEEVTWISARETIPKHLLNRAIVGGHGKEKNELLYIGRTTHWTDPHRSVTGLGKIHPCNKRLFISYYGKEYPYENFEVLCKIEK